MNKNPISVKELGVAQRIQGFDEVVLGYTEHEALHEAGRCLQCKDPRCIQGCPVGIDIKKFIYLSDIEYVIRCFFSPSIFIFNFQIIICKKS